MTAEIHTCSYYCERPECIKRQRDEMRDRMAAALAQQPAAAMGEEIMVNAAHGVYTLPLQPSWLLSGPRFVVYVPAPEQQPAAPSGAVNVVGMPEFDGLMDHIHEYGTTADGVVERANAFARAVIARYAPQQPAAVDEFVTIDGKRYDVDIVRTALPGLASDPATQHQEPKS